MSRVKMRTNVTFRHPAEFVALSDEGDVLAVSGAHWFAPLLRRVPGLEIDDDQCQEDWGVVFFARRNGKSFWIGLSAWDVPGAWLAHIHHGTFAWLQRFSSSGTDELNRLISDVHEVVRSEAAISDIAWRDESEMRNPAAAGFPTPGEG